MLGRHTGQFRQKAVARHECREGCIVMLVPSSTATPVQLYVHRESENVGVIASTDTVQVRSYIHCQNAPGSCFWIFNHHSCMRSCVPVDELGIWRS